MHELCLLCEEDVWKNKGIVELFKGRDLLCGDCRRSMILCNQSFIWKGIQLRIAYVYDDFFASLLFQYKSGDSKLAGIFFYDIKKEVRKYRKINVIIPPSGESKTEERGFVPIELALELYGIKVQSPFVKIDDYEQKKSIRRQSLARHIQLNSKLDQSTKYILIDDVATSGNTLTTCIKLLQENGIFDIQVYLLSATTSFIEMINDTKS